MVLSIALALTACGGGCPTSQAPKSQLQWQTELQARRVLKLRPEHPISIKRDVHNVLVDVDAARFAQAFHDVMRNPARRFGLIRVDRLPERVGKPFTLGEHFQGRYSVEGAIAKQLRGKLKRAFGEASDREPLREWLCRIENGHTSDYGRIAELDLSPRAGRPHVLKYEYLEGSPIAGSSTFSVMEVADPNELSRLGVVRAARLVQIFEYQELTTSFARFFSEGGLKLHNQVVWSQSEQAAALAGGRILESDIPAEYRAL